MTFWVFTSVSTVSSVVEISSVSSYIELHTASAFSFLQGASLPEALVDRAADLGYPALALLDRDGVYGAPRFHKAARAAGIKPIIGAELTIATQDRSEGQNPPIHHSHCPSSAKARTGTATCAGSSRA